MISNRDGITDPAGPRPIHDRWVAVIVLLGAIGAGFSNARPTGIMPVDIVERALFGGMLTWFIARSRPWIRTVPTGVATILAATPAALVLGLATLVGSIHASIRPSRHDRVVGAVIGAVSVQLLLRTNPIGGFGLTAVVVAVTTGIVAASGYRSTGPATRRILRVTGAVCLGFVVVATAAFAVTAWRVTAKMETGQTHARQGLAAAERGAQLESALNWFAAEYHLSTAHDALSSLVTKPALVVPVVSQHVRLGAKASGAGAEVARSALESASVAPYSTLRGDDGTFDLALIARLHTSISETKTVALRAIADLDAAESPWLIGRIDDRLRRQQAELAGAIPRVDDTLTALEMVPRILGADGPRHYLVLFANPAESRGMGGFIGAWAQLDADAGHVTLTRHGHIGDLNDATDPEARTIRGETEFLDRYRALDPERYLQNLSASPDFPTVARVAGQLYEQTGGTRVDGVVYIDPVALAALLELSGTVEDDSLPVRLSSRNAAEFLMHGQYLKYPGQRTERLDLLSEAAKATFDALTRRKLPPVADVTGTLSPMVRQRRLLFSVTDPAEQRYLASLGLTGAFPKPDGGDLFSVRLANASENKADYHLERHTRYTARFDPDTGHTDARATVTLTNHAPSTGEPPYVLGNPDTRAGVVDGRPYGSITLNVSLYSALRPVALTIDGSPVGIQVQRELGAWVAGQTVTIPAGGRAVIAVTYAGEIDPGPDYSIWSVPQPGARAGRTVITVEPTDEHGTTVESLATTMIFDDSEARRITVPAVAPSASTRPGS